MLTDKSDIKETLQRDKIKTFLSHYFVIEGDYTISDDGVVNSKGNIVLKTDIYNQLFLAEFPIQFGYIEDYFYVDKSNITTLKGFPHKVDDYCSIDYCKNIKSLEFSPQCGSFFCNGCESLESLDGLNCYKFYGSNLNLKMIGTNFNAKEFVFNKFPTPTADEMRRFIQLQPEFYTDQEAPWITLIKDYSEHKDMFIAIAQFEELYNEPWIKPENRIEIINSDLTMGL